MELLDDPTFKTKYQKHKLRVKLWESDFMEKYGRRPNKNDIKEADSTIKEAYKMYWKLKTRALEETLTDITFTDDIQGNTSINSSLNSSVKLTEKKDENKLDIDTSKNNTENIDPYKTEYQLENKPELHETNDQKNIQGVWGQHLNKSNEPVPKKKQNLLVGRSSSFQLSINKFTSFSKRNPRKSLSMNKLKNKSEKDLNADTNLPASETQLESNDGFDVNEDVQPLFGETVKVVQIETKSMAQPINPIHQLSKGCIPNVNRNLNQGWLERCCKQNNVEIIQRLSGFSDSGIECTDSSGLSPKETSLPLDSAKSTDLSDEDFICNSDSEDEHRKRVRNFNKRLSDQDAPPTKRFRVDVDSSVSPPPNNLSNVINPIKFETQKSSNSMTLSLSQSDVSNSTENIKDNNINNNKDTVPNLTSDKTVNETSNNTIITNAVEDKEIEINKSKVRRKPRRRIKTVSSDSDPDFSVNAGKDTEKKKMKTKRIVRKKNSEKAKDETSVEKPVRRTRRIRKEKEVDDNEEEELNQEIEPQNVPLFGMETLETVPRFAVSSDNTGDLITSFSKSVSLSAPDSYKEIISKPKRYLTDKEKLEQKIADGKLNDNYVRIDLKKKVYVRGKKSFNFKKYKKNQWKQRKKELSSSEANLDAADWAEKKGTGCFKCGDSGHFARHCTAMKNDGLIPLEEIDETLSYPTLEEAEKMASQAAFTAHSKRPDRLPERASYISEKDVESSTSNQEDEDFSDLLKDEDFSKPMEEKPNPQGCKIPEELVAQLLPPKVDEVLPLYQIGDNHSLIDTPKEVFEALKLFGHETFKPGQEKAVMRILSGQSTLVTLSTGSGKSLCYQLPAYLYARRSSCITLVVSPLVSLMDDQVTGVPSFLSVGCLHTGQTQKTKDTVMEMVKQGQLDVLLVSPEAVVAGDRSTGFGALLRQLPPIAFACIDEAHCISQWSHNFRPSYLMVCRVLKEKLRVKTILGLTATATKSTAESIVKHLDIPDGMEGVISDTPMPKNLLLTVSMDEQKDYALLKLLRSERFKTCDSIIIYCTRREECVRIAGFLRISLHEHQKPEKANAKISNIAEAYHAGLSAYRRKAVQKAFMNDQIRIVVATVAFGMGINKPNIRSVIHYNMPGSFEGYVQEVGRAGRDGQSAQCHLFMNPSEDCDKWELRRHVYANGVDRHIIRRLLQKVFIPCSCTKIAGVSTGKRCPGHEVAIPIDETVKALDISEEIICTLLCYLELHPKRWIKVLSSAYVMGRVSSYNGSQALKLAAQSSPPLAMAIALDLKKGVSHDKSTVIEFPVIDVASAIGWDSGVVKNHLKNLEWKTVDGKLKRSTISVRFDTLGLRVKAPGDLTDNELDEALDALFSRTQAQETSCLRQIEIIDKALRKCNAGIIDRCLTIDDEISDKSEELKQTIREYFKSDLSDFEISPTPQIKLPNEAQIANDVRNLVISYRDNNFNGRAVARIFHGIQSPNYQAYVWFRCRFWRAHLSTDFNALCQIATREILALR